MICCIMLRRIRSYYLILQHITSHYITLHYIAFHCIIPHCILASHHIISDCIALLYAIMSCTMLQHMILEKTTWHYMALYDTMVLWNTREANQYLLDWSDNTVLLPSIAGCIRTGAPMLMEASYRSCGANSMQSLFGRCCNLWIGCYHAPFQAG